MSVIVAPLVGAWIESNLLDTRIPNTGVAPLVGAWIERLETKTISIPWMSLLL